MSRPYSASKTLALNPTGNTGASNLSISSASSGYTSSSDTSSYASLTLSTQGSEGYVYITFAVPTIPSGSTITSVTCSARLRANSNNRITNCNIRLYNGTSAQGTANSIGNLTTTSTVYNITNANAGTWTRSNIANIRLRIAGTRSSSSTSTIRLYGVDLNITYTISGTEYEISITNNSTVVTTNPSTTQYIFQGDSQEIYIRNASSLDVFEITDNSSNVKSSLTSYTSISGDDWFVPNTLVASSGTTSNTNNGLTDETSTSYAQTGGQSGQYLIYSFDVSSIPSNATINSVACSAKVAHTRTSGSNGSVQLYTGSTAKGSASTFGSTATIVNLTTGTWTRSELNSIRIRIGNNYTGNTTSYYTRFYGATLTVTYTVPETGYIYTISNISADHAIIITDAVSQKIYLKVNGSWVQANKVYKKVNGSWVEQSDFTNLFDSNTIYIKV